jgi:hypothetical protein
MLKISSASIKLCLFLSMFTASCFADQNIKPSFAQVYAILQTNCSACHRDKGTATEAWTLDTMPTNELYAQCLAADSPTLCTTYFKLTEGEYPWMTAGDPAESPPYVNACLPGESYHIGESIPAKLSDSDCNLVKNWILQGTPLQ